MGGRDGVLTARAELAFDTYGNLYLFSTYLPYLYEEIKIPDIADGECIKGARAKLEEYFSKNYEGSRLLGDVAITEKTLVYLRGYQTAAVKFTAEYTYDQRVITADGLLSKYIKESATKEFFYVLP